MEVVLKGHKKVFLTIHWYCNAVFPNRSVQSAQSQSPLMYTCIAQPDFCCPKTLHQLHSTTDQWGQMTKLTKSNATWELEFLTANGATWAEPYNDCYHSAPIWRENWLTSQRNGKGIEKENETRSENRKKTSKIETQNSSRRLKIGKIQVLGINTSDDLSYYVCRIVTGWTKPD